MKAKVNLLPFGKHLYRFVVASLALLLLSWLVIYWNQVMILKHILNNLSEEIEGNLSIEDGRIAPFRNFPHINIQLNAVKLFEDDLDEDPLVEVGHIYIGLNFWSIWGKDYEITEVELEKGKLDLYEYKDKSFNVRRAIRPKHKQKNKPSHFNIHSIKLNKVGIQYQKYKSPLKLVFDIKDLLLGIEGLEGNTEIKIKTNMGFSLWQTDRFALLENKRLQLKAHLHHQAEDDILNIVYTKLKVEKGVFDLNGRAKLRGIPWVDLKMKGQPNFASLMALVPVNMQSFWKNYTYKGKAYFDAKVRGNLLKNKWPQIKVNWGADKVRIKHKSSGIAIQELSFDAYFDNSLKNDIPYFSLKDCSLKLDTTYLKAYMHLYKRSIESLDAEVDAKINLGKLGTFLGIKAGQPLGGTFLLNLASKNDRLEIQKCQARLGSSDLKLRGYLQHVAGFFSWTTGTCKGQLALESKVLNLKELTNISVFKNAFNEKIKNLKADFYFQNSIVPTSASKKWLWEFRSFNVGFEEYGHEITKLKGRLWQTEERFPSFSLKGKMDRTDIELLGSACHHRKDGRFIDQFDVELKAKHIGLKDLIGKNKHKDIPEDYAKEALKNFRFKTTLFFKQERKFWEDIHWHIDALEGQLTEHKVDMNFNADIHYHNACLYFNEISGEIGRSDLLIRGIYFPAFLIYKEKPWSRLNLVSNRLDIDQLWTFRPKIYKKRRDAKVSGFNPFSSKMPKIILGLNVQELNFRGQDIQKLKGSIGIGGGQKIEINKLRFGIGGGKVNLRGTIHGENPEAIYFEPKAQLYGVKMDELMANSKKRSILTENVTGALNAKIDGRIQLHSNLKPIIEGSELDVSLQLINGQLENYDPLLRFAKFFKDKNLRKIRFDTLKNEFAFKDNILHIPKMEINSSLGFISLFGQYELDKELNMYARVPFKLVSKAVFQGLFKKQQKEVDENQEDAIVYNDHNKLRSYIYVNLNGSLGNYKLKLSRNPDKEKRSLVYKWKKYKKQQLGR